MSITLTETYDTMEHTFTVTDVPDLKVEFIRATIRPSKLVVKYSRMNGEPWEVSAVDVTGPRVLASGKLSANQFHTEHWYGSTARSCPDWARTMADATLAEIVTAA